MSCVCSSTPTTRPSSSRAEPQRRDAANERIRSQRTQRYDHRSAQVGVKAADISEMGQGDYAAAVGGALDPTPLLRRVVDRTLELIPVANGVAIALVEDQAMRYVCGAGDGVSGVGTRRGLTANLGGLAIETGRIVRSNDTQLDPRVDAAECRRLRVASIVSVPLCRSHEMFGVITVNSPHPNVFSDADVAMLTEMADIVSATIGSACDLRRAGDRLSQLGRRPGASDDDRESSDRSGDAYRVRGPGHGAIAHIDARLRVQRVLDDPDLLAMAFQPIIDLSSGRIIAVEALARFNATPLRPPNMWFADAREGGLGIELEMLAVGRALAHLPSLPSGVAITINVGPETIVSPQLSHTLAGIPPEHVVLELTEHTSFEQYPELVPTLQSLRRAGVRVAVDDAGSGRSRSTRMLTLAPDLIKLDRELIFGIDLDPVRRALVTSLVAFAASTGAEVLAEGVETQAELEVVCALGVRYAQGYYLGRPAPLEVLELERAVPIASWISR